MSPRIALVAMSGGLALVLFAGILIFQLEQSQRFAGGLFLLGGGLIAASAKFLDQSKYKDFANAPAIVQQLFALRPATLMLWGGGVSRRARLAADVDMA
jgi:hypothetical protein